MKVRAHIVVQTAEFEQMGAQPGALVKRYSDRKRAQAYADWFNSLRFKMTVRCELVDTYDTKDIK